MDKAAYVMWPPKPHNGSLQEWETFNRNGNKMSQLLSDAHSKLRKQY